MAIESSEASWQPNPQRLSRRLMDGGWSEIKMLVAGLAVMLAISFITNSTIIMVLLAAVLVMLLWRYDYGRGYQELAELPTELRLIMAKGVIWRASRSRRIKSRSPINLGVHGLGPPGSSLGVIHHAGRGTDHLLFTGRGSSFAASNLDGMLEFTRNLATAVRDADSEFPYPLALSYVFRRRPPDFTERLGYLVKNMDPGVARMMVLLEAAVELDQEVDTTHMTREERVHLRQAQNARTLLSIYDGQLTDYPVGADIDQAAVLAVKRPAWKSGSLTDDELKNAPVTRIAEVLASDLRNIGVTDAGAADLCTTSMWCRRAWDVATLGEYYTARARGEIPIRDTDVAMGEDGEVADMHHWPQEEIIAHRRHLKVDGTYIRVMRAKKMPKEVLPLFMQELYGVKDGWTAISVVSETLSGERESWMLTRGISMSRAWRHSRGNNSYQTPEEEAAMQEQLDRHKQMYRSGNVVQLYNVLIAVSGESERELDRMQRIIETRCRRIRMKMRVVKGRRRQLPAMLTATLGVNHL